MTRSSIPGELSTDDKATGQLLYNLLGARVKQAPVPEEADKPKVAKVVVVDDERKGSRDREKEAASRAELEREKEAFVDQICDSTTRFDVTHWIGRLYIMFGEGMTTDHAEKENEKRMRGLSGMSALNSELDGSSEASGKELGSLSLRAHAELADDNDQATWTDDERLRHYLEGRDPEQLAFVNQIIRKHVRNLQMEVDADLAKGRRAQMHSKGIYTDEKNDLRLRNTRRFMIKQRLEANMSNWLWQALAAWTEGAKQRSVERALADEPTDVDIVFKTLTKPSTNIDPTRMVTQIPQFKTLYTSYSLPANWRDRYLK